MPRWLSARAGAVGGGRELVRSARSFECSIHASHRWSISKIDHSYDNLHQLIALLRCILFSPDRFLFCMEYSINER